MRFFIKHLLTGFLLLLLNTNIWALDCENKSGSINEDYKGWANPICKAFHSLINFSGREPFSFQLTIENEQSKNATFTGNTNFKINTGLLDELDVAIEKKSDYFKKSFSIKNLLTFEEEPEIKCSDSYDCRYKYILPIIAHEMAHYYLGHSVNTKPTKYLEKDADILGIKLLQTAFQKIDSKESDKSEIYFFYFFRIAREFYRKNPDLNESHPFPSERFDSVSSYINKVLKEELNNETKYYQVFSDIANKNSTKVDISDACTIIKNSPLAEHPEFKRELAICYHRLWILGNNQDVFKLYPVLYTPPYSDKHAPLMDSKMNMDNYDNALNAYWATEKDNQNNFDFQSNYAILLAYHPDKKRLDESIGILDKLCYKKKNIGACQNYVIALYRTGKHELIENAERLQKNIVSSYKELVEYIESLKNKKFVSNVEFQLVSKDNLNQNKETFIVNFFILELTEKINSKTKCRPKDEEKINLILGSLYNSQRKFLNDLLEKCQNLR